jgi:isocitrate lyase
MTTEQHRVDTDDVTVGELLARIQRARDWAQLEAQKDYALVEERIEEGGMIQALAQQSRAAAFEAVRVVLEEILAPGTHTAVSHTSTAAAAVPEQ